MAGAYLSEASLLPDGVALWDIGFIVAAACLALKSCEEFGFLQSHCVVNKGGDSKDKPSDSFFALAEEVGLLAAVNQNAAGREAFIQIQKNTGFGHK